ncbi:hypothetical protein [Desulfosporosinus sp. I2]|nr:hypothetical protein [Desulfosporosinus sp. I2]
MSWGTCTSESVLRRWAGRRWGGRRGTGEERAPLNRCCVAGVGDG